MKLKNEFKHSQRKWTTWLVLMVMAVLMTACGGGAGSNSNDTLEYTGKTDQAVIDAANARSLSTQAIGLGFLQDTQTELEPIEKSMEILAGASVKGEDGTPVMGMIQLFEKARYPLFTGFSPLFSGPVSDMGSLEELIRDAAEKGASFPNISGEGSLISSISGAMPSDTSATYEGTLTLDDAEHCTDDGLEGCEDKVIYNGALTYNVTFSFEKYEEFPGDWNEKSPFEKVLWGNRTPSIPDGSESWSEAEMMCYLIETVDTSYVKTDYKASTQGLFTVKTEMGGSSFKRPIEMSGQATIVNTIDGTFTQVKTTPLSLDAAPYSRKHSTVFSGDIEVLLTMDSPGSAVYLEFAGTDTSVTVSYQDQADGNNSTSIDISGNATLSMSAETASDSLNLTGSLNGGSVVFAQSRSDVSVAATAEADATEMDRYETLLNLSGRVELDAKYTTNLLTPVTQTLGMVLNVGTTEFKMVTTETETFDTSSAPLTDEETFNLELVVDADLNVTNGVEPVTLVGNLAFSITDRSYTDNRDHSNDAKTTQGTLTIDRIGFATDTIDAAAKGTITFDVSYPAMARYDDGEPVINLAMDLLLKNKKTNKTCWMNDYKLSTQMAYSPKSDSPTNDGLNISMEGRYYHPDYGYVDITTAQTPFVINGEAIGRSMRNDKDTLLRALFPIQGTLTVQGAEGTQALLKALSEEDTASGFVLPSGYTIHLDTEGDGAFDAAGTYAWPNLKDLIESVWLTRLLYNSSDLLFNYGPE